MDIHKLEGIRHSLAHLLATSIIDLYPGAENAIGPAIENGFYQEFELPVSISDAELPTIEAKMRDKLKEWQRLNRSEQRPVTADEARKEFAWNKYKTELINDFEREGKSITLYTLGNFIDLCKGGHATDANDIASVAFKLDRVAGAYWKGNEKNKMLTRIYGLAFASQKELDDFLVLREEVKKRDHRKIGKELDLFTFSELVGAGLPLWTPKGTKLREILDGRVQALRAEKGYQRVEIPHITKPELYKKSGHWDKFAEELFHVSTREGHEYALKPMNCPHHTQLYERKQWSYREMPQRYANTTMVYRDEQSGELSGLARVLSITQDDAHIFCRYSQIKEEFFKIWDMVERFYTPLGFDLRVRLSFHDPKAMEKYLGTPEIWKAAEDSLREIARERGVVAQEGIGEAAMYGPKIDFMGKDSIGREWQVATIQLDMNMPERFDLTCVNEKGEKERIVMLHAAIMGSIERFLAVLIEHYAGNFPAWLAPVQVAVLPVTEAHNEYAKKVSGELIAAGVRVELWDENERLGGKIRRGKTEKIPYMLVIGDQEVAAGNVTVESRDDGKLGVKSVEEFMTLVK